MSSTTSPGASAGTLLDVRRLAAVRRVLAAGPRGEHLDRLAKLAADVLGAPRAQVSLLAEEQFVEGLHGAPSQSGVGTPVADSLCTVTLALEAPLVVGDTRDDPRVGGLLPVTAGAVRAYLGVPLYDAQGHILGALCVYDDVPRAWTDRDLEVLQGIAQSVEVELELRALTVEAGESAARLDLALTAAEIGSFDLEPRTGELIWDERLIRLFGYDPSSFVQHLRSFIDRVHPEDLARVDEALQYALTSSGEFAAEYRIVRVDGQVRWVEARGRVLGVAGTERLLGIAYDSTELRDARDRVARLLESMTDAFYSLDLDWRFTYVNRQAEIFLGRSRDDLIGRRLWDEFPEAVVAVLEENFRAAMDSQEPSSFEAAFDATDSWYELSAWPGPDGLSVYFRDVAGRRRAEGERERAVDEREQAVVERERAYATADAANQRLQLIADASSRLAATLRPAEVLDTLTDVLLPDLGRWVVVALTAETAERFGGRDASNDPEAVEVVHVGHVDDAEGAELRTLLAGLPLSTRDEVGVGRAVRTREPEWLPQVTEEALTSLTLDEDVLQELRDQAAGSALSLPLLNRGRALGAITIGEPTGGSVDRDLLEDLAARTAVALDNALLYFAQERTAVTLQRSLLPREVPVVPGVTVAASYTPGAKGAVVGGDWYQGVRVGNRLMLAIGDVMGHGMRSAARMGQLRAIVATLALEGHGPEVLLQRLADSTDVLLDLDLATLLVAELDPAVGTLTVASAGHPPPVVAPPVGSPFFLPVDPGPPIGTFPGSYPETVVQLVPASTLVLYTDGLVEQRDASLDEGLEALRQAVAELRLPPEAVVRHVLKELGRVGGADDDVAMLVLAWDPSSREPARQGAA